MRINRMIFAGVIAIVSMGCSNRVVEYNGSYASATTGTTVYDPTDLEMDGYARAGGIPVRVLAQECTGGAAVVLATMTSTTTPSFTADSTGQRGYAFTTTLDLVDEGYVSPGERSGQFNGCVRLAMQEFHGGSWKWIAVFDETVYDCRDQVLENNPNATWFTQINTCKIPTSWVHYGWLEFE